MEQREKGNALREDCKVLCAVVAQEETLPITCHKCGPPLCVHWKMSASMNDTLVTGLHRTAWTYQRSSSVFVKRVTTTQGTLELVFQFVLKAAFKAVVPSPISANVTLVGLLLTALSNACVMSTDSVRMRHIWMSVTAVRTTQRVKAVSSVNLFTWEMQETTAAVYRAMTRVTTEHMCV